MATRVIASSSLCIASVLLGTAPAHARCNGIDIPITMAVRNASGALLADERAIAGTCNGDDSYDGILTDFARDDSLKAELQVFDEQTSAKPRRTYTVLSNSVRVDENDPDGRMYFVLRYGTIEAGRVNIGF